MPLKTRLKARERRAARTYELRVVINSATAAMIENMMRTQKLDRATLVERAIAAHAAADARVTAMLLLCTGALQKLDNVVSQIDIVAEFVVDVTARSDRDA